MLLVLGMLDALGAGSCTFLLHRFFSVPVAFLFVSCGMLLVEDARFVVSFCTSVWGTPPFPFPSLAFAVRPFVFCGFPFVHGGRKNGVHHTHGGVRGERRSERDARRMCRCIA